MSNKKTKQSRFGEFVRKIRLNLNIGLRKFAGKVGISATYISKMEIGEMRRPKKKILRKWPKY